MDLLLTNFWLFCLGAILINIMLAYRRAGQLVSAGRLTEDERQRFTRGALIFSTVFFALLQAILWLSDESSPLCLTSFPPDSTGSLATWFVNGLTLIMLLRWVWSEEGGSLLARMAPAIVSGASLETTYTPSQVRWFVTGVLFLAVVSGIVARSQVPITFICQR